jgi:hypothetical protein
MYTIRICNIPNMNIVVINSAYGTIQPLIGVSILVPPKLAAFIEKLPKDESQAK